jgi:Pyruvate/2-oxoacid:ferredoxin oxidoreductase delta subunit
MGEKAYERLVDALARAGGAVPVVPSDEFTALISELFSSEEADLASNLPTGLNSLTAIGEHVGRPQEQILPILERMADKGLVFHERRNGLDHYKLMAVLPGFFEFQFMKGGTSERDRRLAGLFRDYFQRAWSVAQTVDTRTLRKITPFARVIPVEEEISAGNEVHPYERVAEYIENAEFISVSTCYCRHHGELLGNPCDRPKENCMAFGPNARFVAERGYGRLVSKEEAQRILKDAEETGLVHMSSNTAKYIDFICNCCPCHCGILQSFLNMDMPALGAVSAFRLKIDGDSCSQCEACLEQCPTSALALDEDVVRVDRDRCIGCGLCNSVCTEEVLSMERIEEAPAPPLNRKALSEAILKSLADS